MGSNGDSDQSHGRWTIGAPPKSYALSGKIMLTAIVVLFTVVVFLVVLHIYARWYIRRARRRYLNRRRNRTPRATTHLVFYLDPNSSQIAFPARGLDSSVLSSVPVFVYSSKTQPVVECAVCLSEFEENEKGRILPKCQHSFHTDCIDMWFQSHSTCPLCRSPVEPLPASQEPQRAQPDVVISVAELTTGPETVGSSSGLCSMCQHDGEQSGTSSLAGRRKGSDMVGVTIEVPRSNSEFDDELRLSSQASQGFRSPGSRLLSLKRILSMSKKAVAVSPSSGVGTSCGVVGTESDIESVRDESAQVQTRAQKPS